MQHLVPAVTLQVHGVQLCSTYEECFKQCHNAACGIESLSHLLGCAAYTSSLYLYAR